MLLMFDGDARVSFSGMTEDDKKDSNNEISVERDDSMLRVTMLVFFVIFF